MFNQLPLGITLPDNITLNNFVIGNNPVVVKTLETLSHGKGAEQHLYLWGASGVGKTHLLQGACHLAAGQAKTSTYIPLKQAVQLDPAILQDLHLLQLICIDDVQAIAGQPQWEQGLFSLYQRATETKAKIVWSADAPPSWLHLRLPDLQSRLAASLVLEVDSLVDTDKVIALQQRASARGLELPDNIGHYLLSRCPRHMGELLKT